MDPLVDCANVCDLVLDTSDEHSNLFFFSKLSSYYSHEIKTVFSTALKTLNQNPFMPQGEEFLMQKQ